MALSRPTSFPRWGELVGQQGVPGPNESTPSSGKMDIGWIPGEEPPAQYYNWYQRLVYDWLQWLDANGPQFITNEGFESTTFPPNPMWVTPSPRYPSDAAWVRSTTGPLTGTASASAPTPQGASTNSSIGATVVLYSPSRIQFQFDVKNNITMTDFLALYIDGGIAFQMSSGPTMAESAGTWISDVLNAGVHTFDWRYVRGAAAPVSGEKCLIDNVQILPEAFLRNDPLHLYVDWNGEFYSTVRRSTGNTPAFANDSVIMGFWDIACGANAGYIGAGGLSGPPHARLALISAAIAAGDYTKMGFSPNDFITLNKVPFIEWRADLFPSSSVVEEIGFGEMPISASTYFQGWAMDYSLSPSLRIRGRIGTGANVDSDVGFGSGTNLRLGAICSTVAGISSAVFMKDGKTQFTGSNPWILPVSASNPCSPCAVVRSIGTPVGATFPIQSCKLISLR
jgi:hypothetical protein